MNRECDDLRREFLRQTIDAGRYAVVVASGLLIPTGRAFGNNPKDLSPGKSIYDLGGEVYVDGQRATLETRITANSRIETKSNSHIAFVVGKDAHILRENSQMQLGGEQEMVANILRLVTGRILSVFGTRSTGESYALRTSTATMGIRGTAVYAESASNRSYVCICCGVVDVTSNTNSDASERIKSFHHAARRYILADGTASELIQPAPMKNHADEELILLETLAGHRSPSSSMQGYCLPPRGD